MAIRTPGLPVTVIQVLAHSHPRLLVVATLARQSIHTAGLPVIHAMFTPTLAFLMWPSRPSTAFAHQCLQSFSIRTYHRPTSTGLASVSASSSSSSASASVTGAGSASISVYASLNERNKEIYGTYPLSHRYNVDQALCPHLSLTLPFLSPSPLSFSLRAHQGCQSQSFKLSLTLTLAFLLSPPWPDRAFAHQCFQSSQSCGT